MRTTTLLALLTVAALLLPEFAHARNIYPARIPNGDVSSCSNCHRSARGGGARTPFGNAFRDGGRSWTADLALLDSDGDGFTNGDELLDPEGDWSQGDEDPGDRGDVTNPGDDDSHPPEDVEPPEEGCQGPQPAVEIGAACAADGDCGAAGKCVDSMKGGYCTVVEEDGVSCCPAGSTAFDIDDEGVICLKDCAEDSDCRDGEEAYQTCDDDDVCWGCWIPETPVGAACAGDGDCGEGGTCVKEEEGYVFHDGYCVIDWADYCCSAGSEPVGMGEDEDSNTYCMLTCGADNDCREDDDYLCDNDLDVCWPLEIVGEDTGEADTGEADTGEADTGEADTGEADTGQADTGEADTGQADTGQADTGGVDGDQVTGDGEGGEAAAGGEQDDGEADADVGGAAGAAGGCDTSGAVGGSPFDVARGLLRR